MASVEREHRRSLLINSVIFLAGVAIFASGNFDGKFIGTGVMLYGAIVQALDGVSIEIVSAQDSIKQRLTQIEARLSETSN